MPPHVIGVIPTFTYEDADAALTFLCKAFGFKEHLVVRGEDKSVAHAELLLDRFMVMLGQSSSSGDGEYKKHVVPPAKANNLCTSAPFIMVSDVKAHYERAQEHGATIITELKTQSYGGEDYMCKDLEGHVWCFGSYDPFDYHEKLSYQEMLEKEKPEAKLYEGGCHCGAVRYQATMDLADPFPHTCDCSICQKRGHLLYYIKETAFTLQQGEEALTTYSFSKNRLQHKFCKVCGITCFLQVDDFHGVGVRAVNVNTLDDVDVALLPQRRVHNKG